MKPLLILLGLLAAASPLHGDEPYQKLPEKPVDLARAKNLYTVGYAHLDTQWRWIYPEVTRDYIRNTMEQNFALFDKYPNYVFNFTGSRRYEFMKEYYPEEYARVKKYVASGQWFPAGSSVDEGDANVPSLESMTRHFLYGNHFFQREFGKHSEEFMLPDCFGFPACLPTVLAHGGIRGFSTQKLTWGSAVGIPFNVGTWTGPDGSSVIAALNPGGYGAQVTEDLSRSDQWLKRIDEDGQKSGVYADFKYYGTGDRGGAAKDSTVGWIERALVSGGPVRVISAPADRMFKDISPAQAARLPNYQGELELVQHSDGALSSEAYMKRWNRKNEQLAQAAEGAATAAAWLGVFPYPSETLYRGWDLVLGSQMHDILPGTSVPKAYEYSWNDEVLALNQFAAVTERATAAVLSTLDTRVQGTAVAVYNPLAIAREDPVEATIPLTGAAPRAITAYDPRGMPVPTQILDQQGASLHVLFLASVPSLGYAVYDLRPDPGAAANSPLSASASSLENARYRVALNAGGDVASVFDKSLGQEMLSAPVRLSIRTENSFDYPAWNMNWADRLLPARGYVGGPAKIRIVENGPVRVALEVERTTENSTFVQQVRLAAGSAGNRVEVLNRIDWRTLGASLRADFPLAAANPEAAFDDKVGVVRRGNDDPKHFEMAQQQWMDLTDQDGRSGVSVLNDSKFGCDKPDDHTLRLTMLYTPGVRDRYPDQSTQDVGRHEIVYALAAHRGGWEQGGTAWQAARLNQPLRAFLPTAHPGAAGRSFSLLSLDSDQVQVAAVKKAEDSEEIVVRLKELTGRPAAAVALRFPAAIQAAREVDAQERPIGDAVVKDGALVFDLKKFGLRAFALRLAPAAAGAGSVASQPVPLTYDTDVVSSRAQRTDGAMDKDGGTYPAEMFPAKLEQAGVGFQLGPVADGAKNALAARGQRLALPGGDFNRVHLLAAADGDAAAHVRIGDAEEPCNVPNWTGYIAQWDNRLWDPADTGVEHRGPPIGLVPGYVKRAPVAWFATHHSTPQGDAYYEYSYLFQLSYDLPPGTRSLTLPDDPRIRVFAVSVSREPPTAPPAAPLYDTLADHQPGGAPIIPQAGQTFHDATEITLLPPLYHRPQDLRYTLDGTEPTAASRVYDGPFTVADTVNLAVRQIEPDGQAGPVTRGTVTVHDQTPPRLLDAVAGKQGNTLELTFSEPLAAEPARDPENYVIHPPLALISAAPSANRRQVLLTFGQPMAAGTAYTLALRRLQDTAPGGNTIQPVDRQFNARNIVFTFNAKLPPGGVKQTVGGLPVLKTDQWTMNALVKADARPADRVIIAGFGQDAGEGGSSRYLAVFPDGIRLWLGAQGEVKTNSPLDLGRWQMLTATYDGETLSVYKDGQPLMKKRLGLASDSEASVSVGTVDPWDHQRTFNGSVQDFTIRRGALNENEVKELLGETRPVE